MQNRDPFQALSALDLELHITRRGQSPDKIMNGTKVVMKTQKLIVAMNGIEVGSYSAMVEGPMSFQYFTIMARIDQVLEPFHCPHL